MPSLKANLPYSQFLRVRQICSKEEDFTKHTEDMYKRFVERGYSKTILDKCLEKAKGTN